MMLPLIVGMTLKTATGGTETLFPAHDRRATVVFVVLAECPIARGYGAEMARLYRDYGRRGIRFVMMFADAEPPAIRAQMRAFGLPFTGAKADRQLVGLLKAIAAPTAAIVGADGSIAYVGRIDDRFPALGVERPVRRADLRLALDAFLAGRRPSPSRTTVIGCALPAP